MLELRTHSYLNKTSILHIDRRREFKRKLLAKENPRLQFIQKNDVRYDEKF